MKITDPSGFFHVCDKYTVPPPKTPVKSKTVSATIISHPGWNPERSNDVAVQNELNIHSVCVYTDPFENIFFTGILKLVFHHVCSSEVSPLFWSPCENLL